MFLIRFIQYKSKSQIKLNVPTAQDKSHYHLKRLFSKVETPHGCYRLSLIKWSPFGK